MEKPDDDAPQYSAGKFFCPHCEISLDSYETVALYTKGVAIVWCANGHITIYDREKRNQLATIDLDAIAMYSQRRMNTNS